MPKPKPRLSTKTFLEIGNGEKPGEGSGFISQNRLVKLCASLEGFNLSSETEKASFLRYRFLRAVYSAFLLMHWLFSER